MEVKTYTLTEEELAKYRALPVPKKERPTEYHTLAPRKMKGSMWSTSKDYIKK